MVTAGPMRILIVRLSAIGDTIHGLPVLCALRDHLPSAHLSWVVEQRSAAVLQGHSALDRLIVAPRGWLRSPMAVWRLRRQMRSVHAHITIDLQGLAKSAIAARLSCASADRCGIARRRECSTWLNNRLVNLTASHVVDRYLELLAPLGISQPPPRFDVPRHADDELKIGRFVRDRGLGGGFAVLNPGTGWASKRWPVERLSAVARHLGRDSATERGCLGRDYGTCLGRPNHHHLGRIRTHGSRHDAWRACRTRPTRGCSSVRTRDRYT